MDGEDIYQIGFWITWVLVFLVVWIGCAADGGIIGFCLGWIPAIIIAFISAFLWPLLALAIFVIIMKCCK